MRVTTIDIQEILAVSQSSSEERPAEVRSQKANEPSGCPLEVEVEFSEAAERMQLTEELAEAAWSRLQRRPGVRREVVEELRRRLNEGYYDEGEVLRRAAARILASLPGC